jgi:hypothetical protein
VSGGGRLRLNRTAVVGDQDQADRQQVRETLNTNFMCAGNRKDKMTHVSLPGMQNEKLQMNNSFFLGTMKDYPTGLYRLNHSDSLQK